MNLSVLSNLCQSDLSSLEMRSVVIESTLDTNEIKTGIYDGVEHVICPVISNIGNSIVHAANSPGPEFLPASVLELYCNQRNGRPIVMNHPQIKLNGKMEYVSASYSTEVLESYSIGIWQNARFEDGKVKSEMWLNPIKAKKIGSDAENVIDRIRNGQVIEVSEGNFVLVDGIPGQYAGKEYTQSWILAISDHLACLPMGVKGACGVYSHGCGAGTRMSANRIMSANRMTNASDLRVMIGKDETNSYNIKERSMAGFTSGVKNFLRGLRENLSSISNEMFMTDLSSKLISALSKVEKDFRWLENWDLESGVVIYSTSEGYGDYYTSPEYTMYQRSFTINGDDVSLSEDVVEVEVGPITYKSKTKEAVTVASNQEPNTNPAVLAAGGSGADPNVRPCGCQTPANQSTQSSEPSTSVVAESTTPATASPLTDDEKWLHGQDLRSLRSMVTRYQEAEQTHRLKLIEGLTVSQRAFTATELEQMDIPTLQKLSTMAGAKTVTPQFDYSHSRGEITASGGNKSSTSLPDPYGLNKKK